MSFGFGVCNVIALLEKANKLRDRFADAPGQLRAISSEVSSLTTVLTNIKDLLPHHDLLEWQKKALVPILDECDNVVVDVGKMVDKNTCFDSSGSKSGAKKVRIMWKRLAWDPKDVQGLRLRMASNVAFLNAFLGSLTSKVAVATKDAVDGLHTRQDVREWREQHAQILDWLTSTNYTSQQNDHLRRRQSGTGQWLVNSSMFQTWLNTPGETLFCPGIPGAGKTILTSIVVDHLLDKYQDDPAVGIAYIYCSFRQQSEQRLDDLLSSILRQLSEIRPSMPGTIEALYNRHKSKRTRPSSDELLETLQSVAGSYTRTFVIADALDECQISDGSRSRFLEACFALQDRCKVNLFLTSRFIPDITELFEKSSTLEIHANPEDVQKYLAGQMFRLPRFVGRDVRLQEEINHSIVEAVDGMFLLAKLYIDSLVGKRAPKAIRVALQKLQRGVEAYDYVYHEAMSRIEGQLADQAELAKQALSWIIFAKRPLSTRELQHALATEVGDSDLQEDNLPEIEDVVSVCSGLVAIDEESGVIRLVHYTTQEYFQQTHGQWFPTAEQYITTICATYLSFNAFESGPCQTIYSFKERLKLNYLYDYAVCHWGHHARDALPASQGVDGATGENAPKFPNRMGTFDEAHHAVMDFLGRKGNLEAAIQALFAPKVSRGLPLYRYDLYPKQMTALHLAAYFGLELVVKDLLASGKIQLDARDSRHRTPLYLAVDRGHEAIVRQLLDTGRVDPNVRGDTGWAPLSLAAFKNNEAIVQRLLDTSEVNLDITDGCGRTVLHQAIVRGNEAIAQLFLAPHLLDTGRVDPNAKSVYDRTPLHGAAYTGREAMVRRLLETGKVDPDVKDLGGATPLHEAAAIGDVAIVPHLLSTGKVDPEAKDFRGQTPLDVASKNGHEVVVRQLLAAGRVGQQASSVTSLVVIA